MNNNVAYTISDNGISLFYENKSYTLNRSHPHFETIKRALRDKEYDGLSQFLDVQEGIRTWAGSDPDFKIEGGVVSYRGWPFDDTVSGKICRMIKEGYDPQPIINFMQKVTANPSFRVRRELLAFCFKNDFLIHEDGDVIAYKSTGEDYWSIHTARDGSRVRYQVGDVPTIVRNEVDDNHALDCSYGLHVASYDYASTWSREIKHVMVVKVDPIDFVAVPDASKARVCQLTVVSERADFKPVEIKEVYKDSDVVDDDLVEWRQAVADGTTNLGFEGWLEDREADDADADDDDGDIDTEGKCPQCGTDHEPDALFCSRCGEGLED